MRQPAKRRKEDPVITVADASGLETAVQPEAGGGSPAKPSGMGSMTKVVVTLAALVLVLGIGYYLGRASVPSGKAGSDQQLPTVSLAGFNDKLKALRGKPLVVNFWASWCGPCRREAPALEKAYKKYKNQGLQILGVNSSDTAAGAKGFLEEFKITYPNVQDATDEISVAYRVNGLPTTFFFDSGGKLVDTAVGALDTKRLDEYLADFVKK